MNFQFLSVGPYHELWVRALWPLLVQAWTWYHDLLTFIFFLVLDQPFLLGIFLVALMYAPGDVFWPKFSVSVVFRNWSAFPLTPVLLFRLHNIYFTCMSHAKNYFGYGARETRIRSDVNRQINGKISRFRTVYETIYINTSNVF